MGGTNWSCTQPEGPCSRSDVLQAGASCTALTLTVYVAANAPANIANTVSVTGRGVTNTANDQAMDPTTITSTVGASIWSSTVVPGTPWHADSTMRAGLKVRSDVAETINGIRFYKGAGNNGTHIGLLYSSTGSLLAQATFTDQTTSGWQQVNFSAPVWISANNTYVAAFFSTTGFAYDSGYFTASRAGNAPLHALQSGVDGPNGLYLYGSAAQFPTLSYGDANYWVDVVFQ
jgi:Domain of unknown function (DUF4082)